MRYLFQILWKDQSRMHLLWAMLGTLAGFVLLLSGVHFYENMKRVLTDNQDLLDPEFIIINKKVNIGQTLGLAQQGFTEEEINDLREQRFASRVDPFISNEFPISAYTRSSQFQNFYTELFFEAVPDEYIDVKSDDWNWDSAKEHIPVILPQDYLNLYNFGFAQSQGLPQIPKEMIGALNFYIVLKGASEKATYPGKIIGFSNRINSILVPYEFLTWANNKFGYLDNGDPSRLILVSNDPTNPEIVRYIDQHGYDTIRERLKSSRINMILKFVLSFLVVIAAIIIGLAFLIFLLSLQLMISRSAEKIRRLHKLGFHYREISLPYIIVLSLMLLFIASLSLGLTAIVSGKLADLASQWNMEFSSGFSGLLYIITSALIIMLFTVNAAAILLGTRKLCSE